MPEICKINKTLVPIKHMTQNKCLILIMKPYITWKHPKKEVGGNIQWLTELYEKKVFKELICMTICPEEGHWHVCIIDQSTDLELW